MKTFGSYKSSLAIRRVSFCILLLTPSRSRFSAFVVQAYAQVETCIQTNVLLTNIAVPYMSLDATGSKTLFSGANQNPGTIIIATDPWQTQWLPYILTAPGG